MHARMFKCAFAAALLLAGFGSNLTSAAAQMYQSPMYQQQPMYQSTYQQPMQPQYQQSYYPQQPCCQQPVYQPPAYQPSSCCGGCSRGLFSSMMQSPCNYGNNYAPYPQYQQYPQYQAYPQYPQYQAYPQYQQPYPSYRYGARVAVRTAIYPQRRMINRRAVPHCFVMNGRRVCR